MRTSHSDPLKIAEIAPERGRGKIGITFAPGKRQTDAMTGAWHRDLAADMDVIAAWNAAAVVTLLEERELQDLQITELAEQVRRRHMEWHHWPIEDFAVPSPDFASTWDANSARIRSLLETGANVLVHCKGGLGRAGMIAARLLVEDGMPWQQAVKTVRDARKGAIETTAQEEWVEAGRRSPLCEPARDIESVRDRAVGALVGLAVGDAVGTHLEFTGKPDFARLEDMIGGGPFRLKPGEWTDDTAMALALADSLLAHPEFDPADLMNRFVAWHETGKYSCTGACFDIGTTIRAALSRYRRDGNPLAGSTDERSAGNGALMRLAPVAVRYRRDRDTLRRVAALQTRTTHGAAEAIDGSVLFAEMLADAIAGRPIHEILRPRPRDLAGRIAEIASGSSWRSKHRKEIRGTGYVVDALNASLWAVSRTTCYRSAVLLAANLGEDADTTAAITGQLAGALYGVSAIPKQWLATIAWREEIESVARRLFQAGEGIGP
jgi:ADP-ribosyl-[dinitrogen reductase] hydrolase